VKERTKLLMEFGVRRRFGLVDGEVRGLQRGLIPSGPHAAIFWASPIPASSALAGLAAICWIRPIVRSEAVFPPHLTVPA